MRKSTLVEAEKLIVEQERTIDRLAIEAAIGSMELRRLYTGKQVDQSEIVKLLQAGGHTSQAKGYKYLGQSWWTEHDGRVSSGGSSK